MTWKKVAAQPVRSLKEIQEEEVSERGWRHLQRTRKSTAPAPAPLQVPKSLEKPVVLDPRSLEPLEKPRKTWGAIPQVKPQPLNLHPNRAPTVPAAVPVTPTVPAAPAVPAAHATKATSRCEERE